VRAPRCRWTKAVSRKESDEGLYTLDFVDLKVASALDLGSVICRPACENDVPLLVDWHYGYAQEALKAAPGDALRAHCREVIRNLGLDRQFVLTERDRPVAYSAFNAALPDIVQIGGVWTPPALRDRGYGRMVVAGSLLAARATGASRAVLFTDDANLAARRAHAALGFRRIGDWGMLLFATH
jgi:GNAT superfamily N-acetyltransferase